MRRRTGGGGGWLRGGGEGFVAVEKCHEHRFHVSEEFSAVV